MAAKCIRILFLLAVVALVVAAVPTPRTGPAAGGHSVLTSTRVVSEPIPTATPPPAAQPEPAAAPLTNSGGRIRWQPALSAGPWPTDGTVTLPTLGVRAPIVRVGVDRTANMVVPRNAHEIAWLDQGPFPGSTQNGVLAGHVSWGGKAGSFNRISRLANGHPVVVSFGSRTWTFGVTSVQLVDPGEADVAKIMGYTEKISVTLITCGGTFNRRTRHHDKRWVVRAELVSAPAS